MMSSVERPFDLFDLTGSVVVITGGSTGLGASCAWTLARAGAKLAITARGAERLSIQAEAMTTAGHDVLALATDVSDAAQCEEAAAEVYARFGRIDGLVNNAGVSGASPASRETQEHFQRLLDINLSGTYWMSQACGRRMAPGSSIVNVSSVLGLKSAGLPQAAYSASKAAVLGLTRDLAAQWSGRKGIRVNAIAPGFFATEMTSEYDDSYVARQLAQIPMGRWGDPSELSATVLWLLTAASGYVTGQTIVVDGGYTVL